jgi:hypothetical protein
VECPKILKIRQITKFDMGFQKNNIIGRYKKSQKSLHEKDGSVHIPGKPIMALGLPSTSPASRINGRRTSLSPILVELKIFLLKTFKKLNLNPKK